MPEPVCIPGQISLVHELRTVILRLSTGMGRNGTRRTRYAIMLGSLRLSLFGVGPGC